MKYRVREEKSLFGSSFYAEVEAPATEKSKGLGRVITEWKVIHPHLVLREEDSYWLGGAGHSDAKMNSLSEAWGRIESHRKQQRREEEKSAARATVYHEAPE